MWCSMCGGWQKQSNSQLDQHFILSESQIEYFLVFAYDSQSQFNISNYSNVTMLSLPRLIIVAASRFARGCCSTTSRNFNSPKSLHLTTRTTYNHRILLRTASSSPSSSSSQSNQSHPSQPSAILQFNLADIGEGITECELLQWYASINYSPVNS